MWPREGSVRGADRALLAVCVVEEPLPKGRAGRSVQLGNIRGRVPQKAREIFDRLEAALAQLRQQLLIGFVREQMAVIEAKHREHAWLDHDDVAAVLQVRAQQGGSAPRLLCRRCD